jgi:hypothetical protein
MMAAVGFGNSAVAAAAAAEMRLAGPGVYWKVSWVETVVAGIVVSVG